MNPRKGLCCWSADSHSFANRDLVDDRGNTLNLVNLPTSVLVLVLVYVPARSFWNLSHTVLLDTDLYIHQVSNLTAGELPVSTFFSIETASRFP